MSCGVGRRQGLDLALLGLCCRLAAAAPIRPLAWERTLIKNGLAGVPAATQRVKNPTSIHEDVGSIPGLTQRFKDLALLWLGCRPAAAAPIWSLAWGLPYATGVAPDGKAWRKTD